jgi:hypothetical protein
VHFVNSTGLPAQWTMGFEPDGREMVIVVVKATYSIPPSGARGDPWLADEQQPLIEADRFSGEPGFSAPLHETDFAHRKPACDVLLLGSAHAPHGRPVDRLPVALKLGSLQKQFTVVGPRVWRKYLAVAMASQPEHFQRLPLSYDYAFGGTDRTREAQDGQTDAYQPNPVGRGYWRDLKHIDGQPLPFTEASDQSVMDPAGRYVPMSFSPVGRNWTPRCAYAGTYDQHWLENTAPLWPADFDARYFQAAPADQIVPYPAGGEEVMLQHLTPQGHCTFRLPRRSMPIIFIPHRGTDVRRDAVIDTVVIEPDAGRFTLTWRANLPLGRSVFDVREVVVGEMSAAWHRSRRFPGKEYYRGLGELVAALGQRGSAARERVVNDGSPAVVGGETAP